ncbi:MAG: APC family permease [Dehalococcoidia bacterium]|nr:APC family permease [Dehalococcoidia bacterium]
METRDHKLGDKIYRPQRVKRHRLKRVLGVTALYSAGYGNVGSSIYYALGLVAMVAAGATPVVLGIAGIIFVFNALTYAEGTSMFPEAGGSATFARHAFSDLAGFTSGWALIFSYIITLAISAYIIPFYVGHFWAPLKESGALGIFVAMGIIGFLMVVNVVGVKESSRLNWVMVIADLLTQLLLVTLGFFLLFDKSIYVQRVVTNWPTTTNLIFGIAIAAIAYTGVETMSQMAEETKKPEKQVPLALIFMMITVIIIFASISTVAFSVMTPQQLATEWAADPVAGIADGIYVYLTEHHPFALQQSDISFFHILQGFIIEGIRTFLRPLVAVLAATILLVATNAALLGISRLTFSLGEHDLAPPVLSRIHPRFKTPYVAIIIFCLVAILIQSQGLFGGNFLQSLGGLYAFGSLLSFAFAHASVLALRIKKPDMPRPFKAGLDIHIRGKSLPLVTILGLLSTIFVWIILLLAQPNARWGGFAWMFIGFIIYYIYRKKSGTPLTRSIRKKRSIA